MMCTLRASSGTLQAFTALEPVLVSGPAGAGKTEACRAAATAAGLVCEQLCLAQERQAGNVRPPLIVYFSFCQIMYPRSYLLRSPLGKFYRLCNTN